MRLPVTSCLRLQQLIGNNQSVVQIESLFTRLFSFPNFAALGTDETAPAVGQWQYECLTIGKTGKQAGGQTGWLTDRHVR